MSDQKTIEEKLKDTLNGDLLKNALDFVAYLRKIGATPDNDNRFFYMDYYFCILIFFKDEENPTGIWIICDCPIREHEGFPIDESVKEFARANVARCRKCGGKGCGHEAQGATKEIFGKEYDNLCSSECQFVNPDAEGLKKIKILMELWTHIIADEKRA